MKVIYWMMYILCIAMAVTFFCEGNIMAGIWVVNTGIWVSNSHMWYNCADLWRNRCLNRDKEE